MEDAAFVQTLAAELALPCEVLVADMSHRQPAGIEERGRLLRYGWFRRLLLRGELDAIATGHTLDDQAETVLAKLLRGAWTSGLGGIHPVVPAGDLPGNLPGDLPGDLPGKDTEAPQPTRGAVVRPLLATRRPELRSWLESIGQPWREDASNADVQFTRNRIRHQLLPAMAAFNPQVAEQLAQVSLLAREDESYWQAELRRVLPGLLLPGRPVRGGGRASSTLPGERSLAIEVERLRALPAALRRRVLRAAAGQLAGSSVGFAETARVMELLDGPVGGTVRGGTGRREQLTAELRAERTPRELRFVFKAQVPETQASQSAQEITIAVPGEGAGFGVHLWIAYPGAHDSKESLPPATLRAAQPGDRIRLRYSSSAPKRVKEVLERMGVPAPDRAGWPLLVWQGEVVWLRGAVLEPTPLSSLLKIQAEPFI